MTSEKRRETADEWAARMVREHGPVPLRIGRRLAHLKAQQAAQEARRKEAETTDD